MKRKIIRENKCKEEVNVEIIEEKSKQTIKFINYKLYSNHVKYFTDDTLLLYLDFEYNKTNLDDFYVRYYIFDKLQEKNNTLETFCKQKQMLYILAQQKFRYFLETFLSKNRCFEKMICLESYPFRVEKLLEEYDINFFLKKRTNFLEEKNECLPKLIGQSTFYDFSTNTKNINNLNLLCLKPPINMLLTKEQNSDSETEYLDASEETNKIKTNIFKIKNEIKKADIKEYNKEMLFFIDKCIECKNNITEISLDINLCPITYNVNLGSRIYNLMKVDHESDFTIFEVLQSLCYLTDDLQTFMKSYKVLQINGIIIHPLTKVKELSPIDKYVIVTNISNIDLGIDSKINKNRNILGFKNLGNTCFMNASLQAIINCKEFSDYFYSCDLDRLGNHKIVSAAFSELIKMFDKNLEYLIPSKLKYVIGSKVDIYNEKDEQDSMEFVFDLLNLVHEELKLKKKSKFENIDSYKKWQIENQSIVTSLFFSKIKSSIVCAMCSNERFIFEPCLSLSVPVPLEKKYFSNIVIFYESYNRVPLKIFAEETLTIFELKILLCEEYNVTHKILCCQIMNNTIKVIDDFQQLKCLKSTLFCYEFIQENVEEYIWISIDRKYFFWTIPFDFLILGRIPKNCNKEDEKTYKQNIIDIVRYRLVPFIDQKNINMLYGSFNDIFYIKHKKIQSSSKSILNRSQCFLQISNANYISLFGPNFQPINNMIHLVSDKIDLINCLNLFLEKEYIFGDDKQFCKKCNQHTIHYKDTDLDLLPKYLIIQLKRFRFNGVDFEKIGTFVDFEMGVFYIKKCKYKIISIINHISPSGGYAFRSVGSNGHYTAYIRHQNDWFHCNDHIITKVSEVKKDDAYIFILEKAE